MYQWAMISAFGTYTAVVQGTYRLRIFLIAQMHAVRAQFGAQTAINAGGAAFDDIFAYRIAIAGRSLDGFRQAAF
jgi:hypothetical protein